DADRGAQPEDLVEVGLVHRAQKLPRVEREAVDVAAAPIGVDRVEREARFARARRTREHHELALRDLDVEVREVVLPRTAHHDLAARVELLVGRLLCGTCHTEPLELLNECSMLSPNSQEPRLRALHARDGYYSSQQI